MDEKTEQISLSEIIGVVLKRKKVIALVTIAFLLFGMLQAFVLSDSEYKSEVTLEINNIELASSKNDIENSDIYNKLESIAQAGDMDFDTYLTELTSDDILEKTIKDLNLEDTYSADSLKNSLSLESDEETKVIELKLISNDYEQGNKILEKLIENFREHITILSQEYSQQILEIIKNQMEVEREKYEKVLAEYKEEVENVQSPHELELEIEASYEQITTYKLNLNDLNIRKEGILAALKASESSDNEDGIIIRPGGSEDYLYMDTSEKVLEMDLVETEAKIESTKATIEELQDYMSELQVNYQEAELTESSIVQRLNLTKDSYKAFSKKYEELNMEDSIDIGEITINLVPKTDSSSKPVGRTPLSKLIVAVFLGLMTGVILSLLLEYLSIIRAKSNK